MPEAVDSRDALHRRSPRPEPQIGGPWRNVTTLEPREPPLTLSRSGPGLGECSPGSGRQVHRPQASGRARESTSTRRERTQRYDRPVRSPWQDHFSREAVQHRLRLHSHILAIRVVTRRASAGNNRGFSHTLAEQSIGPAHSRTTCINPDKQVYFCHWPRTLADHVPFNRGIQIALQEVDGCLGRTAHFSVIPSGCPVLADLRDRWRSVRTGTDHGSDAPMSVQSSWIPPS